MIIEGALFLTVSPAYNTYTYTYIQVCEVTKAAREILLKAMGEGLVAPTEAESLVILDVVEVQKNLFVTLKEVMPTPSTAAAAAAAGEEALFEGLTIESSAVSTKISEAAVMEYVSQMTAHLVVYDTLPTVPLNGVTEDAWKYALATTETGQWKGQSVRLFISFMIIVLCSDERGI